MNVEPAVSTTPRDPFGISLLTTLRRRTAAIGMMAWTVPRSGMSAPRLLAAVTRVCDKATADPRLSVIVPGLWKIEALDVGAGRHPVDAAPLLTHPVPEPAQAIAHVGWATGVCQRLGFDPDALRREIERTTLPHYREFCWDGIGADLLVYAQPSIRVGGRALGMLGGDGGPPDTSDCFARFRARLSPDEDRLVAHGLGRILVVTGSTLGAALDKADRMPTEWRTHVIEGIAFAFAMVNNADISHILERSGRLGADVAAPFHDGLVYALVFSEWFGRGLLEAWQPGGPFERELVARARREATLNLERGYPLAFTLAEPATRN